MGEAQETAEPGIYAIGDIVAGLPQLAHSGSMSGIVAVTKIAGRKYRSVRRDRVPACTYSDPQIGSVGLTEAQAKEKGIEIKVGKFPFAGNSKATIVGSHDGFIKIVADAKYGEILGVHIIGPQATELIAEAVAVMELEGTIDELMFTIHAHPTISEAMLDAYAAVGGHGDQRLVADRTRNLYTFNGLLVNRRSCMKALVKARRSADCGWKISLSPRWASTMSSFACSTPASAALTSTSTTGTNGRRRPFPFPWPSATNSSAKSLPSGRTSTTFFPATSSAAKGTSSAAAAGTAWPVGVILCASTQGVGVNRPGAFAELIALPMTNIWRHHPGINLEVAAIFDPFGNAVHTALSFPVLGEDVLITGAGPIGIMAIPVVRHAGARHVVITDLNPFRLDLARKMGATLAVNPTETPLSEVQKQLEMTEGFDVGPRDVGQPAGSQRHDRQHEPRRKNRRTRNSVQRALPWTGVL